MQKNDAQSSCFCKKVEILLEARWLKENTHTFTPYRDEKKYEVITSEK
jgi:hypothetical protein